MVKSPPSSPKRVWETPRQQQHLEFHSKKRFGDSSQAPRSPCFSSPFRARGAYLVHCGPDCAQTIQRGPWVISRSPGSTCFFGAKLKSRAVRQSNHGRLWSWEVDVQHSYHTPRCEGNKGLRCAERAKRYRHKRNPGFFMLSSGWPPCEGPRNRLVPKRGLEPPRPDGHYTLNVARLPIPPLRHAWHRAFMVPSA